MGRQCTRLYECTTQACCLLFVARGVSCKREGDRAGMVAPETLTLPVASDYHAHFREGDMMRSVVPHVRKGGVGRAYVMPNLVPPVKTVDHAMQYKHDLEQACDPGVPVEFLMTLYLHPALTPDEIRLAARKGVAGVKSYPRGVTTNSDEGIESYTVYYPIFRVMEEVDMVLNIHGEVPSDHSNNVCVMNAENKFLKHLDQLHKDFPNLRIVLEHVTTAQAVEMVASLGPTVAATITAHHLDLCVDDWAGKNHNFCKPVAKYPDDRSALIAIVRSGNPKFFLGSDSAPHPRNKKESACGCAGVFTSKNLLLYLASTFEKNDMLDRLPNFIAHYGNAFYKRTLCEGTVTLVREPTKVVDSLQFGKTNAPEDVVVPYRAGETLPWSFA